MCECECVYVFITRVIKLSVVARNEHVSATHIDNSNKRREEGKSGTRVEGEGEGKQEE